MVRQRVPLSVREGLGEKAVIDELAHKKRKTASAAPRKPGGISLGGGQTTQT